MKPLNSKENGAVWASSDTVIWQGPDIPCIKICKGDSVSDIVFKLATELCDVLDTLDVSKYDISCLNLSCAPANFHDFLQILITTICSLQGGTSPSIPSALSNARCCEPATGAGVWIIPFPPINSNPTTKSVRLFC